MTFDGFAVAAAATAESSAVGAVSLWLWVGYGAEKSYPDYRKFLVSVLDVDLWDNPDIKD